MSDSSPPISVAANAGDELQHDTIMATPTREPCRQLLLPTLPPEIIDHILAYLSPVDLVSVSLVNHKLHSHATSEHHWQRIIQSYVPGIKLTSPYPCNSFRELYIRHDPHWFLPKYKVWFCDRDLTGKLVIVRYDERRGVIEGYQLLATSNRDTYTDPTLSGTDQEVVVHVFEPELKLHLDKPVLQLRADNLIHTMRYLARTTPSALPGNDSAGSTPPGTIPEAGRMAPSPPNIKFNRFATEKSMQLDNRLTDNMFSKFLLTRAMSQSLIDDNSVLPFPYGYIWPPPAVPATERISAGQSLERGLTTARQATELIGPEDRPTRRSELCEKAFRIRTWMEMRQARFWGGILQPPANRPNATPTTATTTTNNNSGPVIINGVYGQASRPWFANFANSAAGAAARESHADVHIGEEIATYATLDPELYTPTADQPWRGVWVGDYSGHGCEFLLITQSHDSAGPFDEAAFEATRGPEETDVAFARRRRDARVYRGRLDAVKLTGDPNVPRGETTFMAEDLGEKGYVTTVQEAPFRGARVVKSKGRVATTGFLNARYIESHMLLISENRLAQYWVGFGHISFFERVDIDKFLVPN